MGFMDKAKKLAEQAQQKLEEAQTQFNASQHGQPAPPAGPPPVQYDEHGRPVTAQPPASTAPVPGAPDRPHGDPVAPDTPVGPPPPSPPTTQESARPHGDPLAASVPRDAGTGAAAPSDPLAASVSPDPASVAATPPPAETLTPHAAPPDADEQTAPGPPPSDAPPARPAGQGVPQDRNTVDYTPPQMTSGDPLAG